MLLEEITNWWPLLVSNIGLHYNNKHPIKVKNSSNQTNVYFLLSKVTLVFSMHVLIHLFAQVVWKCLSHYPM